MAKQSIVLKVLTVGDGGVGKTTLLHRYKEGEFLTDTQMTLGVAFFVQQLDIDGTAVMLQLWDFGGQEQFRFMLQRYALGAKGAVVMFDLTRMLSLENIEEWVDICRKDNPGLPLILVGTKLDLKDEVKIIDDDLVMEVKKQFDLFDYIKASSKTGEGVHEIFNKLARKIIELEKLKNKE